MRGVEMAAVALLSDEEGVREGEVLAGKYRIGRFLGAGAMGAVYAARHLLLDRDVAIKFLAPAALGHADAVARFVREARATATIRSEHVVRILDVALRDGRTPYIVMEYLEGCDLAAWLRQRGRPGVQVAVDFVLQACDAIAAAHEREIIHRDIKPANLFAVQRKGHVETIKVLDFGVSKAAAAVSSTAAPGAGAILTEEKIPMGSPCYMSPEQMESARDVDPRTDIWALGVSLYELLSGRLPFEGQSLVQVYAIIKSERPLRLRDEAPHVPRGLEAVVQKCLATERDRRYRSVRELALALVPFGSAKARILVDRLRSSHAEAESERGESSSTPSPAVLPPSGPGGTLRSPSLDWPFERKRERPRFRALVPLVAILACAIALTRLASRGALPTHAASVPSHEALAPAAASAEGPPLAAGTPDPSAPPPSSGAAIPAPSAPSSEAASALSAPKPPVGGPSRSGRPARAVAPAPTAALPPAPWQPPDESR